MQRFSFGLYLDSAYFLLDNCLEIPKKKFQQLTTLKVQVEKIVNMSNNDRLLT